MKKIKIKHLPIIFIFLFPFIAIADNNSSNQYLNIKSWSTKNEAIVYFVQEASLPMVDINILFHAGSAYDGKKFGLSSMTTSLIGTNTNKLSENQLIDAVTDLGTQINSNNSRDSLTISYRSLSEDKYLNPSIKLFSDIINHAIFKNNTFHRVKEQYLTSIKFEDESPKSVATKAFYNALYGNHPYAHSVNGTEQSIKNINVKDIKNFYEKYLVGTNTTITIVGNLS
ncbi:MAG: zinc protease, partial [Francisellaceae bacterium]